MVTVTIKQMVIQAALLTLWGPIQKLMSTEAALNSAGSGEIYKYNLLH
jgi:hypothetical protein